MNLNRIPKAEANVAQLRAYAQMAQLDVPDLANRAQLLAVLERAGTGEFILVADSTEANPEQTAPAEPLVDDASLQGSMGKDDPIVEVTIAATEHPGGKDPVPVSVNGRTLVIQRGQRVPLPYSYFLALQAAVRTFVVPHPSGNGTEEIETSIYNPTVHKLPSEAEIAAWHERTKDKFLP